MCNKLKYLALPATALSLLVCAQVACAKDKAPVAHKDGHEMMTISVVHPSVRCTYKVAIKVEDNKKLAFVSKLQPGKTIGCSQGQNFITHYTTSGGSIKFATSKDGKHVVSVRKDKGYLVGEGDFPKEIYLLTSVKPHWVIGRLI